MQIHPHNLDSPNNPYIRSGDGPWMRRYLRWAAEHYYGKLLPSRQADAAALDRWLYSRQSWPALAAVVLLQLCVLVLMVAIGAHFWAAVLQVVALTLVCVVSALFAWLGPDRHERTDPSSWRHSPWVRLVITVSVPLISCLGFFLGRAHKSPQQSISAHGLQWYAEGVQLIMPAALAVTCVSLCVAGITQAVRRRRADAELARLRLQQERDAQAALATQAQLQLLQAQIQPHFLFNTLTALQHWTDTQDARASSLLRSLTRFLRRSTDSMSRPWVSLSEELELIRDYLHIAQARMGAKRLDFSVAPGDGCENIQLPPAIVLSLVENAIQHGIEPSAQGGHIAVTVRQGSGQTVVEVRNTGAALHPDWQGGVGLSNCRSRLMVHSGSAAELTLEAVPQLGGTLARLVWPLPNPNPTAA